MRIVLFYTGVDSFNYYIDELSKEFIRRNHEIFILDLQNPPNDHPHSYHYFTEFLKQKVDMAVTYDGFGIKDDLFIELWNELDVPVVNILVDHPLRFHPTMKNHPRRYMQFCCDRNHVAYVKKYFSESVKNVAFMPHAGAVPQEEGFIPYGKRKYDILFSGTYYTPEHEFRRLKEYLPEENVLYPFYRTMADYMIAHSSETTEQAVLATIQQTGLQVTDSQLLTIMRCSEPLDWMVRMYYREQVVKTLADAGLDIWLLGRGWENHPSSHLPNVHRIDDRVSFAQTLPYMADARINLNVMPWFKDGTHERIFNIFLQHSLPLTDYSRWVDENFQIGEEIAVYQLEALEQLPELAGELLADKAKAEEMIAKGYEKTRKNYTWANCVDQIIGTMEKEKV